METWPQASNRRADAVARASYRIASGVVGLSLLGICGLAVVQVALRYLFGRSLFWVEEISAIAFIAMVWVAAPALWLSKEHLVLDVLPIARMRAGAIIADVAMIVAGSMAVYASRDTIAAFSVLALPVFDLDYGFKLYPISGGLGLLVAAAVFSLALNLGRGSR
jgi:TRAP-type C4-dicarboxylate transport system permease small subunit